MFLIKIFSFRKGQADVLRSFNKGPADVFRSHVTNFLKRKISPDDRA